ncbi:MAG TPA: asparagine synthase-related protein [Bryobacteraceae bacterium]|nr:asparagine synthase-related protein [Bryobacteraceae bacterium]
MSLDAYVAVSGPEAGPLCWDFVQTVFGQYTTRIRGDSCEVWAFGQKLLPKSPVSSDLGFDQDGSLRALAEVPRPFITVRHKGERQCHLTIEVCEIASTRVFYHNRNGQVIWGTDPGLVASLVFGKAVDLDDQYLLSFARHGLGLTLRSPFAGVSRVPFGATLYVGPKGHRLGTPDWTTTTVDEERSDAACCLALRTAIESSVQEAIVGANGIGVLFSGGLDSSVLLRIAQNLAPSATPVVPISFRYGYSPTADERTFAQALGPFTRIVNVDAEVACQLGEAVKLQSISPEPSRESIGGAVWNQIMPELTAYGIDVVIDGLGGDQLFLASPMCPPHILARLLSFRCLQTIYHWSQQHQTTIWRTYKNLFREYLRGTPFLQQRALQHDVASGAPADEEMQGWLSMALSCTPPLRRYQVLTLLQAACGTGRALGHPIHLRYPLATTQLFRAVLGLPLRVFSNDVEDRHIERELARTLGIPSIICDRYDKGQQGEPLIRNLRRRRESLAEMVSRMVLARKGIVTKANAFAILNRAACGKLFAAAEFLNIYAAEMWLRSRPELKYWI